MHTLKKFWGFIHRPEGFFLAVSAVFGIFFTLLIPPLQSPDEATHFLRAYQISQLHIIASDIHGVQGIETPKSIKKSLSVLSTPLIRFHPDRKYDLHETKAALNIPLNKHDTTIVPNGVMGYSPVGYIPQSVAIAIGVFLNLPVVVLIYAARLASLAAWIGVLFAAIKMTPYKKWAFVAIGLLPMLVVQGISPGIDPLSVGLSALFIASILRVRDRGKRIPLSWWVKLLILACLIGVVKQTSLVVLGFIFLLPTKQFDRVRWRAILKKSLILIIPIIGLFLWGIIGAINATHGPITDVSPDNINTGRQLINIIQHPLRFPQVFTNTFFSIYGNDTVYSIIGNFGWVDTPLPGFFVILGFIFIAFLLLVNYESKEKLSKANKIVAASLAVVYVVGSCLALYLTWSPVDFAVIYGLQGRYFLLALFMLLPALLKSPLKLKRNQYVLVIVIGSISLLIVSGITIYLRYYITFPI